MTSPPTPAAIRSFTLDSAYAHGLLAPREPSMLPSLPPAEPRPVTVDRNPHTNPRLARARRLQAERSTTKPSSFKGEEGTRGEAVGG